MNDVTTRYAPMIEQIAEMHSGDDALCAFLGKLKVNREEWDVGKGGGHFWFEETFAESDVELVDAVAYDSDGARIEITLHLVGPRTNWAEWFRWDGEPVLQWPPETVRPHPDFRR